MMLEVLGIPETSRFLMSCILANVGSVLGLYQVMVGQCWVYNQVMVAQMGVSALSITWANINTGKTPSIYAKPAADIYQDQHTL